MIKKLKTFELNRNVYSINMGMWVLGRSYNTRSTEVRNENLIEKPGFGKKPKCWHDINWKEAETEIKSIQEQIVIATQRNDYKKVYMLQWKILNSFSGRALAVRKVVTNAGGKTPGSDKINWNGPKDYWKAIMELKKIIERPKEYKAEPLRRVYIPKGNIGEMRPLGIPTLKDRAVQALYHLGIDPVVETKSDPNSYGFRKNRSTHDAITAIRSLLDKKSHSRWILEADIRKCFDKIDHEFLTKHTPICHPEVLVQWLKSGVMEEMNFTDTTEGTPQGGIISPLLCNIALNGLEEIIKTNNPLRKGISPGVHVIRYADDLIITGKSKEILVKNKMILAEFLKERGLELNENKTKITHIKEGFDFLGFNLKRYPYNPRLNKPTDQDTVLVIKPSAKGIKSIKEKLKENILKKYPINKIMSLVNPILRGWGEHKRISYHSQATFIKIDHWMYQTMKKWTTRHDGSRLKAMKRYLISTATRKWNWGVSDKKKIINLSEITIINVSPLKLDRNPYIREDIVYFLKRRKDLVLAKFRAAIYKKFDHQCARCGESLYNGEFVELHHIIPQKLNGKYSMNNIQPVHRICHQQITHGNYGVKQDTKK